MKNKNSWWRSVRAFCVVLALQLIPTGVTAQEWVYTLGVGDNLWDFSKRHLDRVTRFDQLRRLNGITDPTLMRPGATIRVPMKWIRSNAVPAAIAMLSGEAVVLRATDGGSEALQVGSLIQLGDQVITNSASSVAISFADKSQLTLYENSHLLFDHLSAHGKTGMVDTRLNLVKGRLESEVTPAVGPGSRFEIQTPSAISAVRGTRYRAAVKSTEQASNIEVTEGKVTVGGANQEILVDRGFGTQVITGQAPTAPRPLLPAPQFEQAPDPIISTDWRLSWSPVTGAEEYRLELSSNAEFGTLLWQSVVVVPHARLPGVPDGAYHVRVRGIDDLGLEGFNGIQVLALDAHPQPPLPLKPAAEKVLYGSGPELLWSDTEEASSYHLEIATDPQFEQVTLEQSNIVGSSFDASTLSTPGTYYWRLRSRSDAGEVGPAGASRSFRVQPASQAITTELTTADDGLLIASWPAGLAGQRFQVQLAADREFSNVVLDEELNEPQLSLKQTKGRQRYLRVRVIEVDDYRGPWGATQTIAGQPGDNGYWWVLILGFLALLGV